MSKSASVKCGECGKANAAGYKFCKGCGAPPAGSAPAPAKPKCGECGKENAAGYKFCKGCGAPPAGAEEKKEPKKSAEKKEPEEESPPDSKKSGAKKAAAAEEESPPASKKSSAKKDSPAGAKCGECGKENAAGYKFCKGCGAPPGGDASAGDASEPKAAAKRASSASVKCAECGKDNSAGYKFCKGCGAPPAGAEEKPKKKGGDDEEKPKKKDDGKVKPGYGSVAVRGGGPDISEAAAASPTAPSGKKIVCSGCGKSNPEENAACSACGDPLAKKKGLNKVDSKESVKKGADKETELKRTSSAKKVPEAKPKKEEPKKEEPKKEEPKKADAKPMKDEGAKAAEAKKPEAAPKKKPAAGSNTCHECEENLANPEQRYCLSCGARQPHAEVFKSAVKRDPVEDDQAADVENLLEEVKAKLAEAKKSPRAAGGGDDGKLKKELDAALAEANKWKNLFNSAAQDVDEKDEVIATQMEKIEELEAKVAELEGN